MEPLATEEKSWTLPNESGARMKMKMMMMMLMMLMMIVDTAGEVIKRQSCCPGAHYLLGDRSVQAETQPQWDRC